MAGAAPRSHPSTRYWSVLCRVSQTATFCNRRLSMSMMLLVRERIYRPYRCMAHLWISLSHGLCRGRKWMLMSSSTSSSRAAAIPSSCFLLSGTSMSVLKSPATISAAPWGNFWWHKRRHLWSRIHLGTSCTPRYTMTCLLTPAGRWWCLTQRYGVLSWISATPPCRRWLCRWCMRSAPL